MPVTIKSLGGGRYQVKTPNAVHANSTTLENAEAQERLLNAIEHGWRPDGEKRKPKLGGR